MNNRLILRTVYDILCLLIFLAASPLNASSATYFIGHLNPDTDSIVSSIVAAQFYGGVAARTGELNKETQYLLERTHTPIPILIRNFEDKAIGIVDFNQSDLPPVVVPSFKLGWGSSQAIDPGGA